MIRAAAALGVVAACSHGAPFLRLDTSCLEGCRSFDVAVYEDGYVTYDGRGNVELRHHFEQLGPDQLHALDARFAAARLAAVHDPAYQCHVDDDGTLIEIFYRGTHVAFFSGCDKTPIRARGLLAALVEQLDLDRWFDDEHAR